MALDSSQDIWITVKIGRDFIGPQSLHHKLGILLGIGLEVQAMICSLLCIKSVLGSRE